MRLWECLSHSKIPIISSDHSPTTALLKKSVSFVDAWGGIAGCQNAFELYLSHGLNNTTLSIDSLAAKISTSVSDRFQILNKGKLLPGYDADIVLYDPNKEVCVDKKTLQYKNKISPYIGQTYKGKVVQSFLRGKKLLDSDGKLNRLEGRLIKPA